MNFKDYTSYWDNFLNKWNKSHEDLIRNDKNCQAFFPKDSSGNIIKTELYKNITCMPEPYYFGDAFLNAEDWSDFKDAIVVLDLNPGLSHDSDYRKTKGTPNHDILDDLGNGRYSTMINPKYSPFISTDHNTPGVTWWKSKRLVWFNRFFSQSDVRSKMFAVELCPFHSKSWNIKLDSKSIEFVKDNVLDPVASIIASNGQKRLGYCFGKDWEKIFNIFGFKKVAQWGIDYDNTEKPFVSPDGSGVSLKDWPKRNKETIGKNNQYEPINRIYKLYQANIHDKIVYFLCMRGCGTFAAPGKEFEKIEEAIKEDMSRLYSISL